MTDRSRGLLRTLTRERRSDWLDLLLNIFWLAPAVACLLFVNAWAGLVLVAVAIAIALHTRYSQEQARRRREQQRVRMREPRPDGSRNNAR